MFIKRTFDGKTATNQMTTDSNQMTTDSHRLSILTAREIDALIAFLTYVDSTGKYPLGPYRIRWYGTVEDASERR